jgi:hypothetical protein
MGFAWAIGDLFVEQVGQGIVNEVSGSFVSGEEGGKVRMV